MSTAITPTPVPTTQPGLVASSERRVARAGGDGRVGDGCWVVGGTGTAWGIRGSWGTWGTWGTRGTWGG